MSPSETFERLILPNADKWITPTDQTTRGHMKDGAVRFSISSTVAPGEILTRQRDNTKWLITDLQQTAACLECPALRCDLTATIKRRSLTKNSFGRCPEQLDTIATAVPIVAVSHRFLPPPREGGNSAVEYSLSASADFDIRQGDTLEIGADTAQVQSVRQTSPGILSIQALG